MWFGGWLVVCVIGCYMHSLAFFHVSKHVARLHEGPMGWTWLVAALQSQLVLAVHGLLAEPPACRWLLPFHLLDARGISWMQEGEG